MICRQCHQDNGGQDNGGPWCMCILCEPCIEGGAQHVGKCPDLFPLAEAKALRELLESKRDVERDCQECEGRGIVYVECLEHDEDGDYEECPACDGYRVEVKCPACGEWCSPSSRDPEGSDTVHACQEDRT